MYILVHYLLNKLSGYSVHNRNLRCGNGKLLFAFFFLDTVSFLFLSRASWVLAIYSDVPNKSYIFYSFLGFFPTYMALLGPTRLFIFGKRCHLHGFLLIKYQKNPTYMPLLGPTSLLISEITSTLIRNSRVHVFTNSLSHPTIDTKSLNNVVVIFNKP